MPKILALVGVLALGCNPTVAPVQSPAPPTTPAPSPAPSAQRTTTVLLVRHAEKDTSDPLATDPGLTGAGLERARCLAEMLDDAPVTHLFATEFVRTRATLEPLAERKGTAIATIEAGAPQILVERLRALPPGSLAVVATHSNLMPALVRELGGELRELDDRGFVPDHEYDRIVQIQWNDNDPMLIAFRYCRSSPTVSSADATMPESNAGSSQRPTPR